MSSENNQHDESLPEQPSLSSEVTDTPTDIREEEEEEEEEGASRSVQPEINPETETSALDSMQTFTREFHQIFLRRNSAAAAAETSSALPIASSSAATTITPPAAPAVSPPILPTTSVTATITPSAVATVPFQVTFPTTTPTLTLASASHPTTSATTVTSQQQQPDNEEEEDEEIVQPTRLSRDGSAVFRGVIRLNSRVQRERMFPNLRKKQLKAPIMRTISKVRRRMNPYPVRSNHRRWTAGILTENRRKRMARNDDTFNNISAFSRIIGDGIKNRISRFIGGSASTSDNPSVGGGNDIPGSSGRGDIYGSQGGLYASNYNPFSSSNNPSSSGDIGGSVSAPGTSSGSQGGIYASNYNPFSSSNTLGFGGNGGGSGDAPGTSSGSQGGLYASNYNPFSSSNNLGFGGGGGQVGGGGGVGGGSGIPGNSRDRRRRYDTLYSDFDHPYDRRPNPMARLRAAESHSSGSSNTFQSSDATRSQIPDEHNQNEPQEDFMDDVQDTSDAPVEPSSSGLSSIFQSSNDLRRQMLEEYNQSNNEDRDGSIDNVQDTSDAPVVPSSSGLSSAFQSSNDLRRQMLEEYNQSNSEDQGDSIDNVQDTSDAPVVPSSSGLSSIFQSSNDMMRQMFEEYNQSNNEDQDGRVDDVAGNIQATGGGDSDSDGDSDGGGGGGGGDGGGDGGGGGGDGDDDSDGGSDSKSESDNDDNSDDLSDLSEPTDEMRRILDEYEQEYNQRQDDVNTIENSGDEQAVATRYQGITRRDPSNLEPIHHALPSPNLETQEPYVQEPFIQNPLVQELETPGSFTQYSAIQYAFIQDAPIQHEPALHGLTTQEEQFTLSHYGQYQQRQDPRNITSFLGALQQNIPIFSRTTEPVIFSNTSLTLPSTRAISTPSIPEGLTYSGDENEPKTPPISSVVIPRKHPRGGSDDDDNDNDDDELPRKFLKTNGNKHVVTIEGNGTMMLGMASTANYGLFVGFTNTEAEVSLEALAIIFGDYAATATTSVAKTTPYESIGKDNEPRKKVPNILIPSVVHNIKHARLDKPIIFEKHKLRIHEEPFFYDEYLGGLAFWGEEDDQLSVESTQIQKELEEGDQLSVESTQTQEEQEAEREEKRRKRNMALSKFSLSRYMVFSAEEKGYTMTPNYEQLIKMSKAELRNIRLKVGRKGYGEVLYESVNLTNVDLTLIMYYIVRFETLREVVVYPDVTKKPQVGQGLNVPALVTLENCYDLRDPDLPRVRRFELRLRDARNTRFVSYDPEPAKWAFRVDHF